VENNVVYFDALSTQNFWLHHASKTIRHYSMLHTIFHQLHVSCMQSLPCHGMYKSASMTTSQITVTNISSALSAACSTSHSNQITSVQ